MRLVGAIAVAALCAACGGKATVARPAAVPQPARAACPERAPTAGTSGSLRALAVARVGQVCLVGASDGLRSTARAAVRTKAGATLDRVEVRDDLRGLLRLPDVEDAAAYARRERDGTVTVIYALAEFPTVAALDFDGVHAVRDELQRIPLAKGGRYRPWVARQVVDELQRAYTDRGYCAAKVGFEVGPAGPGAVRVRFTADEHPQCHFGAITFQGNEKVSAADLASASGLAQGATWSDAALERAPLLVEALLWNRGLIESWVDVKRGERAADESMPITFVVREGGVFRLRRLGVAGIPASLARKLLPKLKSKTNRVFVRDTIRQDVDTVRDAVRQLNPGKDVQAAPDTKVDEKRKSVDVVIRVKVS